MWTLCCLDKEQGEVKVHTMEEKPGFVGIDPVRMRLPNGNRCWYLMPALSCQLCPEESLAFMSSHGSAMGLIVSGLFPRSLQKNPSAAPPCYEAGGQSQNQVSGDFLLIFRLEPYVGSEGGSDMAPSYVVGALALQLY